MTSWELDILVCRGTSLVVGMIGTGQRMVEGWLNDSFLACRFRNFALARSEIGCGDPARTSSVTIPRYGQRECCIDTHRAHMTIS